MGVYYAKIENNEMKFKTDSAKLFKEELQDYEGKDIQISIGSVPKSKSKNQENYFHLILNLLSKETGSTMKEMKDSIKQMFDFVETKTNIITKEQYVVLRSSTEFTVEEYTFLLSCTIEWIKEFYPEFKIPDAELFNLQRSDYERPK